MKRGLGSRRQGAPGEAPRVLFYSHDSYGLGHLSRTVALARALLDEVPEAVAAILTGSPRPDLFPPPERCELTLLPPITKNGNGDYVDRAGTLSPAEVHLRRGATALRTAFRYKPDLFVVDHTPAGARGELLGTLRTLRALRPSCRIVYGMRDIIDQPEKVRRRFAEEGAVRLLREVYDAVLVYGSPDLFDPVREYGLPGDVEAKIRFTGYLGRGFGLPDGTRRGTVLVTPGGGEDGAQLLEDYLRDFRLLPPSSVPPTLLVAGPFLPPEEFLRLQGLAAPLPGVRLCPYIPRLQTEMAKAELVVCRAGYNTLCEALSLRRRILAVPRTRYRKEQPIRAQILSDIGALDALLEHPLPPGALAGRVLEILDGRRQVPRNGGRSIPLDGLRNAARLLASMLLPCQAQAAGA